MNRVELLKGLIKEVGLDTDPWEMADKVMQLWADRYDDLGLGDPPDEDEVFAVAQRMQEVTK